MNASSLPTFPWARLRRTVGVTTALFFVSFAGLCDDDDDDGGTGPSADCLDEFDFSEFPFDEDDVATINVGASRNGSITTSDIEVFFGEFGPYYYDIYVLGIDDSGSYTISVNPSGDFDADLLIISDDGDEEYIDDLEDPTATETFEGNLSSGCYLIGVSSPIEEMTGSYSISIED